MPTYPEPLSRRTPPPTSPAPASSPQAVARQQARRGNWLKTLHQWHWISSAVSLFGMLMFAITGITLNHSGAIEAKPRIETRSAAMPDTLAETLRRMVADETPPESPLPADAADWVAEALGVQVSGKAAEWSEEEIYLALPRPGGDAWLRLDLQGSEAEYELTDRGWIAWLNDLHKGRNSGEAWSWFIDIFAVACVVFSVTGLLILQVHAANRASVWPVVGLGVVLPTLLILLFVH
ncbi:PepSY-associated TM helix domain-containing protein [Thauera linaloolentis]|uniref:PepSY-associated TM helix domain-containing protein n=1 Tax=Thauera linaloolentis (strain DSM 12138 / JCM 21573 / CCUG 41526 / CIP 105981 / IAM 15112 / NBRC 102519 / 47Lol) TaxID=1123367 RepID=N6YAS2_THAL4|nr:PepSY-associated TM helix domain-containing protein [Thauera linaloolentis]ENO88625.1 PepSY-associated TM helix domain-containing protein [Thauera linaloolentis 47Lol = DSM 12138]MCM8565670.1 PepSY-associated TM helix domain-containing protein [Thauera linaloolentis]